MLAPLRHVWFLSLPILTGFALGLSGPIRAEPQLCQDPMLLVDDAGSGLADEVCTAAISARSHLEGCHLKLQRPVTVAIRSDLDAEHPHCVGVFHCSTDRIEVLPPDVMWESLHKSSPFRTLSAWAYFESIVVHELAHAVSEHTSCLDEPCRVDREYVAYALQIDSLSERDRNVLLNAWPVETPFPKERINEMILSFVRSAPLRAARLVAF